VPNYVLATNNGQNWTISNVSHFMIIKQLQMVQAHGAATQAATHKEKANRLEHNDARRV
jgi:hypothetical protein